MQTPLERLLDAVRGRGLKVKRLGDGFQVQCPAHEDREPSLSVTEARDGKVLLLCRTGCDSRAVIAALGLEWSDLFEHDEREERSPHGLQRNLPARREQKPARRPSALVEREPSIEEHIATAQKALLGNEAALERLRELRGWSREAIERLGLGLSSRGIVIPVYDAEGRLVNVQFYLPDPETRGDRPKMDARKGCPRDLVPTPESLADEERDGWVFVLEGEPDCVAVWSHGLVAVSCPGVNGWKEEWAQRFAGLRVCVVFDSDNPGRTAARKIARQIASCALETRLLDLRPDKHDGFDLTDWFFATTFLGSAETQAARLVELAEEAELVEPNGPVLISFARVKRERTEWLIPGRVPLGALTLLVGDPGDGKSLLTCRWAADLSLGGLLDGPYGAILVNAEDSLRQTIEPRLEAAGAGMDNVYAFALREDDLERPMAMPDDLPDLEQMVRDVDAKLVVIDPLSAHLPEKINSWSDQSVRRALAPLYKMAERTGAAVVVVAHLNKNRSQTPLNRIGASIGIPAAARSVLVFGRHPQRESYRVLAHAKCNVGPRAPSLQFELMEIELDFDGRRQGVPTLFEDGTCNVTVEQLLGQEDNDA